MLDFPVWSKKKCSELGESSFLLIALHSIEGQGADLESILRKVAALATQLKR